MNTTEVKKIQDAVTEKASGKLSTLEVDQLLEKVNAEITNIHNCENCLQLDKKYRSNDEEHYRDSIETSEEAILQILKSLDAEMESETDSGSVDAATKQKVDDLHTTVTTLKASVEELLKRIPKVPPAGNPPA